eukprot:Tamp_08568.p1 GENE.Tamp_08568~~Tamp_08568.p1  ORF type:complete len:461 (+),score=103.25 Tamp_08568:208-1383(+)
MTTVLMKRNGKVETKWIDEAVLECAMKKMGESMAPPAAEGGDEEEGDEEEGDEEEAAPLCVRPSVGERAKWEASDDCTSVADWLAGMGVYGDAPAEEPSRRRRLLSVAPGRLQTLDGDDAGDEGEEEDAWDPAGKSPLENWNHDTLQEIYDTYYGDGGGGGGGDDDAEEPEEEGDEEGPCERVVREAREMPTMPRASDCFGPPHTLCQIDCAAECMRAPQTPNNMMLKSARMQMLFGPGDLLIGHPVGMPNDGETTERAHPATGTEAPTPRRSTLVFPHRQRSCKCHAWKPSPLPPPKAHQNMDAGKHAPNPLLHYRAPHTPPRMQTPPGFPPTQYSTHKRDQFLIFLLLLPSLLLLLCTPSVGREIDGVDSFSYLFEHLLHLDRVRRICD